jgi:hypothetical protein
VRYSGWGRLLEDFRKNAATSGNILLDIIEKIFVSLVFQSEEGMRRGLIAAEIFQS